MNDPVSRITGSRKLPRPSIFKLLSWFLMRPADRSPPPHLRQLNPDRPSGPCSLHPNINLQSTQVFPCAAILEKKLGKCGTGPVTALKINDLTNKEKDQLLSEI